MKLKRFAIPVLGLALGTSGLAMAGGYTSPQGSPPPGYYQDHDHDGGWDAPPAEFQEIERRGFHDGVEGARQDYDNHRRPDVNNRDEYRHPHVPHDARRDYREGFRRGYDVAMHHLMGDRR